MSLNFLNNKIVLFLSFWSYRTHTRQTFVQNQFFPYYNCKSIKTMRWVERYKEINEESCIKDPSAELLWRDDVLDRFTVLKFDVTDEYHLKALAKQFCLLLKRPNSSLVTLICGCIANMTDVFEGTNAGLFSYVTSNQTKIHNITVKATLMTMKGSFVNETKDFNYADKFKPDNFATVENNDQKFFDWLIDDTRRIRSTLGILSMSLLRCASRPPTEVMVHCNGIIYTNWRTYFLAPKPEKAFYIPMSSIIKLDRLFADRDYKINDIIAMLIRKFDELKSKHSPRINRCHDYFLFKPLAYHGYQIMRAMDKVEEKTGWTERDIEKIINETGNSILMKQIANYKRIIRYIREKKSVEDGTRINTSNYMYARILDGSYFVSISIKRNRELACFFGRTIRGANEVAGSQRIFRQINISFPGT